jgi:branched-chain amino acid transport system permease protein
MVKMSSSLGVRKHAGPEARRIMTPKSGGPARGLLFVGVGVVVAVAALVASTQFLSHGWLFWLCTVITMAVFAESYYLMIGSGGMLSFGHAASFGIGAYSSAKFIEAGLPLVVAMLSAMAVAAVGALVVGWLSLRTTGVQFAILTLAFSMILYELTFVFASFTGGDDGFLITRLETTLFGAIDIDLTSVVAVTVFIGVAGILAIATLWIIDRSRTGLILRAVRDDPDRAAYLGFSSQHIKLIAFVISGTVAGLAGALFVLPMGIVTPTVLFWTTSSLPLVMVLIGGMFRFWGAVVGAVIYQLVMRWTENVTSGINLYVGILVTAIMLFLPGGVLSRGKSMKEVLGRLVGFRAPATTDAGPSSRQDSKATAEPDL